MNRGRRTLAWLLALAVLAAPPLDAQVGAVMARLLLLEMPAWIVLGALAGRRFERAARAYNPQGLTGLCFFLGAVGFWMIPRSVDLVGASPLGHQAMHASLLAAGAALGASVRAMPFVVRGALGIYGASMTFALGMLYSSYSALLCGTFNLAQQKATGHLLLVLCPLVVLFVVGSGARALARPQTTALAARAVTGGPSATRARSGALREMASAERAP